MKMRLSKLLISLNCLAASAVAFPLAACSDLFPKEIKVFAPKTVSRSTIVENGVASLTFVGFTFQNIEDKSKLSVTPNFSSGVAQFIPEIINFNKTSKSFDIRLNILNVDYGVINGDFTFTYDGKALDFISSRPFSIDLYKQKTIVDPYEGTSAKIAISQDDTPTSVTFKSFSYDNFGDKDFEFIGIKNDVFEPMEPSYRVTNFNIKTQTFDLTVEFAKPKVGVYDNSFTFFYKENVMEHQNIQIFHLEIFDETEIIEPEIGMKEVHAINCSGEWTISGFKYLANLDPKLLTVENTFTQDSWNNDQTYFESKITNVSTISKTFDVTIKATNCKGGDVPGHFIFKYNGKLLFESSQKIVLRIINPIPMEYITTGYRYFTDLEKNLLCISQFDERLDKMDIPYNCLVVPRDVECIDVAHFRLGWLQSNPNNHIYLDFSNCNNLTYFIMNAFISCESIAGDIILPASATYYGIRSFALTSTSTQYISSLVFPKKSRAPIELYYCAFQHTNVENGLILCDSIVEGEDASGSGYLFKDSKLGYIDMTDFKAIPTTKPNASRWFENCVPFHEGIGKLYLDKSQEAKAEDWTNFLRNDLALSEECWEIEFVEK